MKTNSNLVKKLLPERHNNLDFFIPDIFDGIPIKDDMASMSYPIFSLSTKTDTRDLEYFKDGIQITIKPTSDGLPTIFDKDVLLYCGSLIMEQINKGVIPPKKLRISAHDLLVSTNRTIDKDGYQRLKNALKRLQGVSITTNIKVNKRTFTNGFGLIDSWQVVENSHLRRRMVALEITLSDWFYQSLIGREVLTINREYFRLRKPVERRLYEIARKHCGKQTEWSITLSNLKDKAGSSSDLKKFRFFIRQIEVNDHLPDYKVFYNDKKDIVIFYPRNIQAIPSPANNYISLELDKTTVDKAKKMVSEAETGWDFYAIYEQFSEFLQQKEKPKNMKGAFIGFVKAKIKREP
jgi:plasmid replication initiation protein